MRFAPTLQLRGPRAPDQERQRWLELRYSRLKTSEELMACKRTAEVYKVDEDTDNISEEEGYPIWDQVEKADEDEVKQFVETTSRLRAPAGTPGLFDTIVIDATWIRKSNRYPDGRLKIKPRLCAAVSIGRRTCSALAARRP